MFLLAHEVEMRLHGIDPDEVSNRRPGTPEGTEMRMPGGAMGVKPKMRPKV